MSKRKGSVYSTKNIVSRLLDDALPVGLYIPTYAIASVRARGRIVIIWDNDLSLHSLPKEVADRANNTYPLLHLHRRDVPEDIVVNAGRGTKGSNPFQKSEWTGWYTAPSGKTLW